MLQSLSSMCSYTCIQRKMREEIIASWRVTENLCKRTHIKNP